MGQNINVSLKFQADTSAAKSQVEALSASLQKIQSGSVTGKSVFDNISTEKLQQATIAAEQLGSALNKSLNSSTGHVYIGNINNELAKMGTNLSTVSSQLLKAGTSGQQSFMQLANAIATAEAKTVNMSSRLTYFMRSISGAVTNQLSRQVLDATLGTWQKAYSYVQNLNSALNDIRIVTGRSTDDMAKFAQQANEAAKALSTTTIKYSQASLIYFQQGLGKEDISEVTDRADTTVKLANVTGQSAQAVSEQLTAIWNNFHDYGDEFERYADIITALGATTASSSAEIAQGLSKFAAIAETVGLSYDYATSSLATLVAATRQSADTVGTSLKTLFSRLQGLALGDTLEDGLDLNKYSKALKTVGVDAIDANGNLRAMDDILEDLAGSWARLTEAQKMALAQTVAGVRQYPVLISLMENWDSMQKNLSTAAGAKGTLNDQAKIYAESWEAANKQVRASMEDLYSSLISDEFFIDITKGMANALNSLDKFIEGIGGIRAVLTGVAGLVLTTFGDKLETVLGIAINKVDIFGNKLQELKTAQVEQLTGQYGGIVETKFGAGSLKPIDTSSLASVKSIYGDLARLQIEYNEKAAQMGPIQKGIADQLLEQQKLLAENATSYAETIQENSRNGEINKNSFVGYLKTGQDYYNRHGYLADWYNSDIDPNISMQDYQDKFEEANKMHEKATKYGQFAEVAPDKLDEIFKMAQAMGEASERMRVLNRDIEALSPTNFDTILPSIKNMVSSLGDAYTVTEKYGDSASIAFKKLNTAIEHNKVDDIKTSFTELFSIINKSGSNNGYTPFAEMKQALLDMAKEADLDADAIEELKRAMNSAEGDGRALGIALQKLAQAEEESRNKADQAASTFEQLATKVQTAANTIITIAGVLSSSAMAIKSAQQAFKSFGSGDILGGIISLVSALTMLKGATDRLTKSAKFQALAQKLLKTETMSATAAIIAQKLAVLGLIAIIGIAALVVKKLIDSQKAQRQAVLDAAQAQVDAAKAAKETADANEETVQSFNEAKEAFEETEQAYQDGLATYEELQAARDALNAASEDACEVYNIEGGAVLALTGQYDKLTEAILKARQAEASNLYEKAKQGYEGASTVFEQKFDNGYSDDAEGKLYHNEVFTWGADDEKVVKEYIASQGFEHLSSDGLYAYMNVHNPSAEAYGQLYEEVSQVVEHFKTDANAAESETYRWLKEWLEQEGLQEAYNQYLEASDLVNQTFLQDYDLKNNTTGEVSNASEYLKTRDALIAELANSKNITEQQSEAYKDIVEAVDEYLNGVDAIKDINTLGQATLQWSEQNQKSANANKFKAVDIFELGKQLFGENWDESEEQLKILLSLEPTLNEDELKDELELIRAEADNMPIQNNIWQAEEGFGLLEGEDKTGKNKTTNADWQNWWEENLGENGLAEWAQAQGYLPENSSFFDWLVLSDDKKKEILNSFIEAQKIIEEQNVAISKKQAQQYIDSYKDSQGKYRSELGQAQREYNRLEYIKSMQERFNNLDASSDTYAADYKDIFDELKIYDEVNGTSYAEKGIPNTVITDEQLQDLEYKIARYKELIAEYDKARSIVEEKAPEDDGLDWAKKFEDKVSSEGLKYDEIKEYADYLKDVADETEELADTLDENSKAALQLAERFKRLNNGVKTIKDTTKAFQDVLDAGSNKTSPEYIDALKNIQASVGDLLDIDGTQLTESFYTSAENLELMQKAAEGDAEAIDQLRINAANDIVQQCVVNINDEEVLSRISDLQTVINDFAANNDLEIGASLDDTAFLAACEEMINKAGMTAQQAQAYLTSLGIDADVKEVPIEQKISRTVTVPTINYDSNGYPMLGEPHTETYTDITTGAGGFTLEVSNATWGGHSGGGINKAAADSGKSKKSGSGSDKKQKTKKHKPIDTKDRYHTVNEQLEDISNNLKKVGKEQDRAFGIDKIEAMSEQLVILNKQIDKYGDKLKEAENYLVKDKATAENFAARMGMTMQYGINGEVLNWDALHKAYLDWYNAQVDRYNSGMIDDDAFEDQVDQVYEDALKAFDQLEETNNLVQELKQNILEAMQSYEDMLLAIQKEKLELRIQVDENGMKMLEYFFDKLDDDLYDGIERMSIMEDKIANLIDQAAAYEENIANILGTAGEWITDDAGEKIFQKYGLTLADLPSLLELSPEELTERLGGEGSNLEEIVNQLQEDYNNLLDTNSDIIEQRKKLIEEIGVTFEAWNERIDDSIDKIDEYSQLMEHYRNVIDIIGRKTLKITSSFIKDYNLKQINNDIATLTGEYAQLNEMRASATELERRILDESSEETRALMQKELDDINKAIREQTEQTAQAWEDCMRGIQERYEDTVAVALEDWQTKMAGLADSADMLKLSFDMATDIDDNYLDDYDKIYELTKLTNDINQSINDTDDLEHKQDLIDLMEKVNDLNQSDADISEYTVDVLNARYELLKAEAALKETLNAKDTVRLTQDNEGNWGYVYTADEDKIKAAEEEYADKLHALEEINQNYLDELDQKLADLAANASDKINEIIEDNNLTLEEKKEKIQEVYEYTNEIERYLMEQTEIALNDAMEIYDIDARKYSELTNSKMLDEEKWVDTFEEMKFAQITGFKELGDWDDIFAETWHDTINDIINTTDEFVERNEEAMNIVGMTIADASEQMSEDLEQIADATDDVKDSIVEMAETASDEIQSVIDFAGTWSIQWSLAIDAIIEKNEQLAASCDTIIAKLADAQAANDALLEQQKEVEMKQETVSWTNVYAPPSASGGGSGSSSSGGYDGGGSTSSSGGCGSCSSNCASACTGHCSTGCGGGCKGECMAGCGGCGGGCGSSCSSNCASACTGHCSTGCGGGCKGECMAGCGGCGGGCGSSCSSNCTGSCTRTCIGACNTTCSSASKTYLDDWYTDTGGYTGTMQYADSGMYTGEWPNGSVRANGRLAFLHQKELVLNAHDTENFLDAIEIVRKLNETLDLDALSMSKGVGVLSASGLKDDIAQTIDQNVSIKAEFPNVQNRSEIEEAFNNLVNKASQYANRKR